MRFNLDVGTSAVFGFLYPMVSFSEQSENPIIPPPDPQILKPHHAKRSLDCSRSARGVKRNLRLCGEKHYTFTPHKGGKKPHYNYYGESL